MLSIKSRIPKTSKKPGSLQPVLPLVPVKLPSSEDEKSKYVTFELKTRVGAPNDSTKYKKYVRKFEEGTPQEWIDLLRDLEEIWTQNSMNGGQDRAATVRALVAGESEVAFDSALQDARTDAAGVEQPVTADFVKTALQAVTATVFPHRALEIQKLWMTRRMYKPVDLTTRQTAAAINRLNNALPLFPTGNENSKFSATEIIGLLEWSLPPAWRAKFDLDGYVPTLHSKARLIEACEAIERNEVVAKESQAKDETKSKPKGKFGKSKSHGKKGGEKTSAGGDSKYYCSEHGNNPSHDTSDCWTLKNRANKAHVGRNSDKPKKFSNKGFRKEINFLAKNSSKKKVLDLYATAVKREQAKLAKKIAKKREREQDMDTDSDSDASVMLMSEPRPVVKSSLKKKKKIKNKAFPTEEEEAYQKRVKWLQDHGEPLADAATEPSEEDSADGSSGEE